MTVNVSIVTYHTDQRELSACLDSLLRCDAVGRVDVVDNGSETRLRDFCAVNYPDRVVYTPNVNNGYGAGNNLSMRKSIAERADYHLVINSDVYFEPGTLEACLEYMESHPAAGQLIPSVTFPDGSFQPVCHRIPSPADLLIHRFVPASVTRRWRDRYEMRCYDLSKPLNVPYHHGCFMLLRVKSLERTGLFDERYFMYPEDIDMTRRMHEHYETIFFPGATIVHAHRAASRTNLRMLWIHAYNMLKYFKKWGFFFDPKRRKANGDLSRRLKMK